MLHMPGLQIGLKCANPMYYLELKSQLLLMTSLSLTTFTAQYQVMYDQQSD